MESLSVSVRDLAGLDELRPVTGGVPLAEGAALAGVVFRLSDEQGRPVPLQAEALGRWKDGSARWVLLDFQADPPAGGQKEYALSWGDGEAPAHPEAVVCEGTNLRTGDAKLEPGDGALLKVADRFDSFLEKYGPTRGFVSSDELLADREIAGSDVSSSARTAPRLQGTEAPPAGRRKLPTEWLYSVDQPDFSRRGSN